MAQYLRIGNFFNSLEFKEFNSFDIDFFLFSLSELQYSDDVTLSAKVIRERIGYKYNCSNEDLLIMCRGTFEKLLAMHITVHEESQNLDIAFNVYDSFVADFENMALKIRRGRMAKFYIGDLAKRYTMLDIQELSGIKGVYSKRLYMLLKSYRSTGVYRVTLEHFIELMDIPSGYAVRDIMKLVTKSVAELQPFFENLSFERKMDSSKRSRIKSLAFSFRKMSGKNTKKLS